MENAIPVRRHDALASPSRHRNRLFQMQHFIQKDQNDTPFLSAAHWRSRASMAYLALIHPLPNHYEGSVFGQ